MEKETIRVTDELGVEKDAEVVLCFEKDGKNYIIYTFNETDAAGMIILYSSIVKQENGENIFESIPDKEWTMVKDVMNKIVLDEEAK